MAENLDSYFKYGKKALYKNGAIVISLSGYLQRVSVQDVQIDMTLGDAQLYTSSQVFICKNVLPTDLKSLESATLTVEGRIFKIIKVLICSDSSVLKLVVI